MYYRGMFDTSELVIAGKVTYKKDMTSGTDLEKAVIPFMNNDDFVCADIVFRSQVYKPGDIIVVKAYNQDEIKVGLVMALLVRKNKVFFVIKEFLAKRHWLRFFKASSASDCPVLSVIDASLIADYKPLNNQGTSSHPFFCLHHHISHSFD